MISTRRGRSSSPRLECKVAVADNKPNGASPRRQTRSTVQGLNSSFFVVLLLLIFLLILILILLRSSFSSHPCVLPLRHSRGDFLILLLSLPPPTLCLHSSAAPTPLHHPPFHPHLLLPDPVFLFHPPRLTLLGSLFLHTSPACARFSSTLFSIARHIISLVLRCLPTQLSSASASSDTAARTRAAASSDFLAAAASSGSSSSSLPGIEPPCPPLA